MKSKNYYKLMYVLYVVCLVSPIRERRFSESEIITLTPTMPLSTNANSTTPNKDIPVKPIPSPRTRRC